MGRLGQGELLGNRSEGAGGRCMDRSLREQRFHPLEVTDVLVGVTMYHLSDSHGGHFVLTRLAGQ